jgi:hypothetical protein
MPELIALLLLLGPIRAMAQRRGRSPLLFSLWLLACWLTGELVGLLAGSALAGGAGVQEPSTLIVYGLALLGAAGGAACAFLVARWLKPVGGAWREPTPDERGRGWSAALERARAWGKRWRLLLGAAVALVLAGYVALWFVPSGPVRDDAQLLAAIQPGMTRQQVEEMLGRRLARQLGHAGIYVLSDAPDRKVGRGLTMEWGMELMFDEHDILQDARRWSFVRPESLSERLRGLVGL